MHILQDLHSSILATQPPHQCPNFFLFHALKFYIYIPTAQIYASHLIYKLCSSFIRTNPPTTTIFFLYSNKSLSVIFLVVRENQPQRWCRHCEGEMSMLSVSCIQIFYIMTCRYVFPFCWVWMNFCINKILMELCEFVCGFCIFVWL